MKEHPIIFSTPMVQAILEGRKTQTRRFVKHKYVNLIDPPFAPDFEYVRFWDGHAKFTEVHNAVNEQYVKCPFGEIGDTLWVRESFAYTQFAFDKCLIVGNGEYGLTDSIIYKADRENDDWEGKWKPSIHMPRIAARIILEITNIKIERLQDISFFDAEQEGIKTGLVEKYRVSYNYTDNEFWLYNPQKSYETLWNKINGEESWEQNPWVWVIEFKKVENPLSGHDKPTSTKQRIMRKYEPYDLSGFIEVDANIECSNCKKVEGHYSEDEEYFFNQGWRATSSRVYCPVCAPLKLKLPQIKSTKQTRISK